ncbi:MAG: chemotaxis protein CheA [Peptococcaceae bacterium]|nr:chemotaxis protein CheA [Peptococcaceae bacterium]
MGEEQAAAALLDTNNGFDSKELLGFFLQEANEQVEKLTDGLLELEKSGPRQDLVNELFRNVHTLKGSSGTMGFMSIVRITHLAEDLLDKLRQGNCAVSSQLIDLLLNVTDRVRSIIANIQDGGTGNLEVADLVSRLENFNDSEPTGTPNAVLDEETYVVYRLSAEEIATLSADVPENRKMFEISVRFVTDALMPSVRAMMIMRRLQDIGQVLRTVPSNEDLHIENKLEFYIVLATDQQEKIIRDKVMQVADVQEVSIWEFCRNTAENPAVKPVAKPIMAAIPAATVPVNDQTGGNGFKNQTIRVPAERLDDLLNLVGEMVIARTRLVVVGDELKHNLPQDHGVAALTETNVYLGRLMNELQESVMAMRMVPVGQVFSRFPRLVRDIARKTGKDIDLVLSGEETELDKTIIEAIGDPLMHIVRNAIDHGVETPEERIASGKTPKGTVRMEAFHEGSHIVLTVSDDGHGINLQRVKEKAVANGLIEPGTEVSEKDLADIIFLPGFSTAEQVTDISGRGVGMDVVKKSLVNIGGLIEIVTAQGKGTSFIIRLPLTLAIIQALLVEVGGEIYAVPLASVLETLRVVNEDIKSVGGQPVIQLRGNTLPLISLQKYFDLPQITSEEDVAYVIVVGFGEKRLGLIVDGLKGQQEIVIKSLGDLLANVSGFSGATIGGDGKVTLILDVGSLISDTLASNGARGVV